MKSLFKFALLSALIIGGKLAKQPTSAAIAEKSATPNAAYSPVVLVRENKPYTPVKVAQRKAQPEPAPQPTESGIITEMF